MVIGRKIEMVTLIFESKQTESKNQVFHRCKLEIFGDIFYVPLSLLILIVHRFIILCLK